MESLEGDDDGMEEEEEKTGGHDDPQMQASTASAGDVDDMEQDADSGGEMDDGACDAEMLPLPFTAATPIPHSHSDGGDGHLDASNNSAPAFVGGSSLSQLVSVALTDSSAAAALPSSACASASAPAPDAVAAFGLLRVDSMQRRSTISDKRAAELEFNALHGQHVFSTRRRAATGAFTYRGSLRGQQRHGVGQSTYDSGAVFVGEYRDDKCNGQPQEGHTGRRLALSKQRALNPQFCASLSLSLLLPLTHRSWQMDESRCRWQSADL